MTYGITFSSKFPQITMSYGGKIGYHGINEIILESISVNVRKITPEKSSNYEEVTIGSQPFSEYMGRSPRTLTLSITFDKSPKELRAFAQTLNRQVKTVDNIFMPGMILTITSTILKGITVGSIWQVDTFTTDRSSNRGTRFDADLTLMEYNS
jgi:hypothetical protein